MACSCQGELDVIGKVDKVFDLNMIDFGNPATTLIHLLNDYDFRLAIESDQWLLVVAFNENEKIAVECDLLEDGLATILIHLYKDRGLPLGWD